MVLKGHLLDMGIIHIIFQTGLIQINQYGLYLKCDIPPFHESYNGGRLENNWLFL